MDNEVHIENIGLRRFEDEYMSTNFTRHTFRKDEWKDYLEKKMLDKIMIFMQKNQRKPTHFIMNPQDIRHLTHSTYYIQKKYDGFYRYRDMDIISSYDLVEGEIMCL